MKITTRLIHVGPDEAWTDQAVASLVGQTPKYGDRTATVPAAQQIDDWIVATLDLPEPSLVHT